MLEVDPALSSSSGTDYGIKILPTITASGTESYTGIYLNSTETSTGSGTKLLIDLRVGGTSKFKVDNTGALTWNSIQSTYLSFSGGANISQNVVFIAQLFSNVATTATSPALSLGNETGTGIFSGY